MTALNPKGIAFFIAFLPQFISPAAPVAPQLFILGATFPVLAIVSAVAYAIWPAACANDCASCACCGR